MPNPVWFCGLIGRRKKDTGRKRSSGTAENDNGQLKVLHVKLEGPVKCPETDELRSSSFSLPVPFAIPVPSSCRVKLINHGSPVGGEVEEEKEVAYEGEDEHEEKLSLKRDNSDFDLQAHVGNTNHENDHSDGKGMYQKDEMHENEKKEHLKDAEEGLEMAKSGHISDPGTGKAEFWAPPNLVRSCSDLGMKYMARNISRKLAPTKAQSFEELQKLAERMNEEMLMDGGSPVSAITGCSADKVMLKKHSSSQILPSRSRKLWWKLFLWSHRNLHRAEVSSRPPAIIMSHPALNQQGGYSSDTLEPRRILEIESSKVSPNSLTGESLKNSKFEYDDNRSWDGFHGASGLWPQNQWVALPVGSPKMTRVDEWVKELAVQPPPYQEGIDDANGEEYNIIDFPPSPSREASSSRSPARIYLNRNVPEELAHANSVIQSLNSSSTVAHIVGIGLKVVPHLWHLSSLRSVNLSGNAIVHVSPGSLPKGLHTLNLSRNKITTIEGLRELTRLRVLDLSYNRIARIGQGLSNCTLIKELYLAGNKISDVEGLHRLLKLTILDLSFNKITTTKALGQLVANYNSLQALNLIGNPIQSNIHDEQLRKTVCSLLPKLAFLNKQPINPQKAREVRSEAIAKAALGNNSWSTRRKTVRKSSQGTSSSSTMHRSSGSVSHHRTRQRSRSRSHHHHSSLKEKSSSLAF